MSGLRRCNALSGAGLRARSALCACMLCALALALCFSPAPALAVVNLGTVSVSVPGSVSLVSGETVSVSAVCNPSYSDQLPCCLNDYCPSGCDFDKEYGSTGVGCEDASGQCTCFGYGYSRYYPTCTVASSDPSVARATWADGVLVVSGHKPGVATVTVYPSMRLWSSAAATITVNVLGGTDAASDDSAPADVAGASGVQSGAAVSAGGGAAAVVRRSAEEASSASGVVSQAADRSTSSVEAIVRTVEVAGASGDSPVVETENGDVVAHLGEASTDVAALLSGAAGRDMLLSLWGGKSPQTPDYVWMVGGLKLPADYDYTGVELTIDEVTQTNSALRAALGDEPFSAFTIAGSGKLPSTMQLMWRSVGTIDNGQVVDVYLYDEDAGTFKKVHSNLKTEEGYVTFNLIERGTYVVTADSGLSEVSAVEAAANDEVPLAAGTVEGGVDWAIFVAVAVVVVVAAGAAYVFVNKKKKQEHRE